MSYVEEFVELLHTDPETLEGVPSNEEIIAANESVLKGRQPQEISDAVRSGFLQMWQMGYVRDTILGLSFEESDYLVEVVREEMADKTLSERRAFDVRFIFQAAQSAKNNHRKDVYRQDNGKTAWSIPPDIFWNKEIGASNRRLQWVVDNHPSIPVERVAKTMAMEPSGSQRENAK